MTDQLLRTKFQLPPKRDRLVSRPGLIERLNTVLPNSDQFVYKLTMISAPAGYGKTTLVVNWAETINLTTAWLSLDEDDNDPARFLTYLIAALGQVDSRIPQVIESMLQAPQPPPNEVILTALLNQIIEVSPVFILILDDYHLIKNPAIHQQLNFLLEHQPSQMHLVLLTRVDPPLPLPRLRARGQMNELRQDELRFSQEEAADFLQRIMGLHIEYKDISALLRRTEGWATGLQLAGVAMQSSRTRRQPEEFEAFVNAFTGSNRYILDYLFEEVFLCQSPQVQNFLLHTSILNRLTASLCDSLCVDVSSQNILAELENANMFIVPLDQSRTWYRYHRLFADLLRHRLHLDDQQSINLLHRKASRWYSENGYMVDAIHHALAGNDWDNAGRLIDENSDTMLKRGEIVTMLNWFNRFPEEYIKYQPELCLTFSWPLILSSLYEDAEKVLGYAEPYAQDQPKLQGGITLSKAYLARSRGDTHKAIQFSEQALALLPESDLGNRGNLTLNLGIAYWHAGQMGKAEQRLTESLDAATRTGNHYGRLATDIFLERVHAVRGELRQAEAYCQEILKYAPAGPLLALVFQDLSTFNYEWNDLETAWKFLRMGEELCQNTGNQEFLVGNHILEVRLHLAQDQLGAAIDTLTRSHRQVKDNDLPPPTRARRAACNFDLSLSQNDLQAAQTWIELAGANVHSHSFYRFLGINPARLLLASGMKDAARESLLDCLTQVEKHGWGYGLIATRSLLALAADTEEDALNHLRYALEWAQSQGHIRTIIETGDELIPLLEELARKGFNPGYLGQLLAVIKGQKVSITVSRHTLIEPLSDRELEVLRLVAAGLSNREIAAKLILSLGTVKSHVHNIYGKLGVRNRTEAVTRAQEYQLL